MRIETSGAERFLSWVDGDASFGNVWDHPAYEVVREHAELLGRDLTPEAVRRAVDGAETVFSGVESLDENRERIRKLLDHVEANERAWVERVGGALERVTPGEAHDDVTVHLGIGYDYGVGGETGAYLNLNAPLFHDAPRELLYTSAHECSHVLYERVHHSKREVGPEAFETRDGQRTVFNTVVHSEAFATYTPLPLRRADGTIGERDHVVAADYRVIEDDERLSELVARYDSFRDRLGDEAVPRDRLFTMLFGGQRLPYRVGTALLAGVEQHCGLEAVQDAFYASPTEFTAEYDWVLDEYRTDG
ncbi:hypothetical protein [Halosimplex sp. J119]